MTKSVETTPKRRQKRGLATEERVLKAAGKLMQENGFEAAQISRIVQESGVSNGSFYHHFGSKEEVIRRLVERFYERGKRQFEELELSEDDFDGSLDRVLRTAIAHFEEHSGLYRAMSTRVQDQPELWEPMRALRRLVEARLIERLGPVLKARGVDDPDLAFQTMLQTILAIMTHTVLLSSGPVRVGDEISRGRIQKIARAVLDMDAKPKSPPQQDMPS